MAATQCFRKCSKRTALGCIVVVTILVTLCFYNHLLSPVAITKIWISTTFLQPEGEFPSVTEDDRYSIRTPGCAIERIDLWDPVMNGYFWKEEAYICPKNPAEMLVEQTDDGYLKVNESAKNMLIFMTINATVQDNYSFICYKRFVYRNKVEEDDRSTYRLVQLRVTLSDKTTQFQERTLMDAEYAEVKCMLNNVTVYHNYFFNIVRKPDVEEECKSNAKTFLANNPSCSKHPQLSVLVVGIDSLSKPNFLRQMPMTFDLIMNQLNAIDMLGYNKVGLNTFPCLMPYLTGNSSDELAQGCWGGGYNSFDNCTFLWDLFASAGYRTAFVENHDYWGLLLLNMGGSHRQLAHYYGHTLYIPVTDHAMQKGCWRGLSDDERLAEWAYKFQKDFANDLHYGHFWLSRFSHDYVNMAQHLDPLMHDLFKTMNSEGMLNSTLLIFMSDHGVRYGNFRETEKGRQEENMPFMYLLFPQWFQEMFPGAIIGLRTNRHRLITLFDLHRTLKDILYCNFTTPEKELKPEDEPRSKGQTLFRPISRNRTCDDAGIPAIYCSCLENLIDVDINTGEARGLARMLVSQLNNFTQHVRSMCVEFSLKSIMSVKKVVQLPEDPDKMSLAIRNTHIIAIEVKPGKAKFEATIQLVVKNSTYIVNHDVRRINRYGDTSNCITNDRFLRTICYCSSNELKQK